MNLSADTDTKRTESGVRSRHSVDVRIRYSVDVRIRYSVDVRIRYSVDVRMFENEFVAGGFVILRLGNGLFNILREIFLKKNINLDKM